jgi:hypothetical protein
MSSPSSIAETSSAEAVPGAQGTTIGSPFTTPSATPAVRSSDESVTRLTVLIQRAPGAPSGIRARAWVLGDEPATCHHLSPTGWR